MYKWLSNFVFSALLLAIAMPVMANESSGGKDSGGKEEVSGYVFDVTVSSVQELDVVLNRADSLRALFNPQQHGRIAIVLHGDELQLFEKGNYSANQSLVDRARLLDRDNIIDIKACQTMMRTLNIQQSELPAFIEQVPYAPVEIFRLKNDRQFKEITPGVTNF